MRKILLVSNTGWYLYNFRLPLARYLRARGIDVVMVSPYDAYVDRILAEGFRWIKLKMNRRSVNPFREVMVIGRLSRIYRREQPDAVHHFTAKCVIYGTVAAKLAGVRAVVNAVTGIGHIFMGTGLKAQVLRPVVKGLYRNILTARRVRVVFQNPDDLQLFSDDGLVVPNRTILIRGSGVNVLRFAPRPGQPHEVPVPIVLFAARVNGDKGVYEFVEAARQLRESGVQATFQLAGSPDVGNPTAVPATTLEYWRKEGAVDLLGHVDGIEEIMAQASIVVLPTHGGEGVPRVLLEAAAMGKPIVTTDVPGCREAVVNGENGYLVPAKNVDALTVAIERLLSDHALRQKMGTYGRAKMIEEFDDQDVAKRTALIYQSMGVFSSGQLERSYS